MVHKIGMVHTSAKHVSTFDQLVEELMPGTEIIHMVDEGILKDIIREGDLNAKRIARLATLATFAVDSGAEAVMLTCSTAGPGVDKAKDSIEVPFLKVDEAMADRAVELGRRIGVVATLQTTIAPTSDLIRQRAAIRGTPEHIETFLCRGAFEAFSVGDTEQHDLIVIETVKEVMARVDVIVLAQASMASVLDNLPDEEQVVPILSSPRLAVEHLRTVLEPIDKSSR
jgi:Asp/Glu/hydantoin racemase